MMYNNDKNILFSLIVPVYNTKQYLIECIDSIIKQEYDNYEIIIIEDGSTDGSLLLCEQLASQYKQIKLHKQTANRGLSEARNTGIRIAKGEYILFIDSDDSLLDKALLAELNKVVNKSQPDCILFQHSVGNNSSINYLHFEDEKESTGQQFLHELYKQDKLFVPVWKWCYSKTFIMKSHLKFVKGLKFEDLVWTMEYLFLAKRVVFKDILGYRYVIHDNSITTSIQEEEKCIHLINAAIELDEFKKDRHFSNKQVKRKWKQTINSLYIKSGISILKRKDSEKYKLITDNISLLKNINSIKYMAGALYMLIQLIIYKKKA